MPFSATIKLGTVGVAITSVKLYGCTGTTDCTGCTVLTGYENVSVSSIPTSGLTVSGIPNGVRYIQAEALGACSADAVKQCISISGIPGATPAPTSTPVATPLPTPNPTATTPAPTPSQTTSEATICQYTLSGQGYPLSGGGGTNSGLIKVGGSSAIYVWARYNSAGTSSGTASFSMTIGGVTANGSFTITGSGQVGYTNNGGTNNLHYIRLTPGTYQYSLTKSDTYSAGNNINFTWSTGTDPNSSTNMDTCLSQPPGPYLSADGTPNPTPTQTIQITNCVRLVKTRPAVDPTCSTRRSLSATVTLYDSTGANVVNASYDVTVTLGGIGYDGQPTTYNLVIPPGQSSVTEEITTAEQTSGECTERDSTAVSRTVGSIVSISESSIVECTGTLPPPPGTVLNAFYYGQGVSTTAGNCGTNYSINSSFFATGTTISPLLNQTIYTTSGGTTAFDGGGLWYPVKLSSGSSTLNGDYDVIKINSNGFVEDIAYIDSSCTVDTY